MLLRHKSYDEDFARVTNPIFMRVQEERGFRFRHLQKSEIITLNQLVAPLVSYTINTSFTAAPNPACLGAPVTFTWNTILQRLCTVKSHVQLPEISTNILLVR